MAARPLFIYIPDVATEKSVPPVLVSNKLLAEELDQYAKGKYCELPPPVDYLSEAKDYNCEQHSV